MNFTNSKTLIFIGRLKNGKSTIIKNILNLEDTDISCDLGIQNDKNLIFSSKSSRFLNMNIIETPGLNTNDDYIWVENLQKSILDWQRAGKIERVDGIIIVDSLIESSNFIRNALNYIRLVFGKIPCESIGILLSKKDFYDRAFSQNSYKTKLNTIKKTLQASNIPEDMCISFLAPHPEMEDYDLTEELPRFEALLGKLQPITEDLIRKKEEMIHKRAREIQETTKIKSFFKVEEEVYDISEESLTLRLLEEASDSKLSDELRAQKDYLKDSLEVKPEDDEELIQYAIKVPKILKEMKEKEFLIERKFEECVQDAIYEFRQGKLVL